MAKQVQPPFDPHGTEEWTGVDPVAAWLGVDHQVIRAAIKRGDLPAFQPGGPRSRILIQRQAVLRWVARGRVGLGGRFVRTPDGEA